MKCLRLRLQVDEVNGAAAVTFRLRGDEALDLAALRAGDWILLAVRLFDVTFRGGFLRTAGELHISDTHRFGSEQAVTLELRENKVLDGTLPDWAKKQLAGEGPAAETVFSLDPQEIYLASPLGTFLGSGEATIAHVQYDGAGEWLDLEFRDGRKIRYRAEELYHLLKEKEVTE